MRSVEMRCTGVLISFVAAVKMHWESESRFI